MRKKCGFLVPLDLSPSLTSSSAINHYDSNILFVSAFILSGLGRQHANQILTVLGHPEINCRSWDAVNQKTANAVETLWSCVQSANVTKELSMMEKKEKDAEGRTKLVVSFDGTWTRRGYSSLFGAGTYLGGESHLPLFTSSQCRVCHVHEAAERKGHPVKDHHCSNTWSGSAGSMEALIAIEGAIVIASLSQKVCIGALVGDGDSKIDYHFKSLPSGLHDVDCFLDKNHIVKNFTTSLYSIQSIFNKRSSQKR
jgi:hypothetical protein